MDSRICFAERARTANGPQLVEASRLSVQRADATRAFVPMNRRRHSRVANCSKKSCALPARLAVPPSKPASPCPPITAPPPRSCRISPTYPSSICCRSRYARAVKRTCLTFIGWKLQAAWALRTKRPESRTPLAFATQALSSCVTNGFALDDQGHALLSGIGR